MKLQILIGCITDYQHWKNVHTAEHFKWFAYSCSICVKIIYNSNNHCQQLLFHQVMTKLSADFCSAVGRPTLDSPYRK
jgi:hypothetical protein